MTTLIEMCSWKSNIGWQGVTCHHCQSTHNVMCGIPGILCERCGKYIVLSWFGNWQQCLGKPNFGYNRSVIHWAMRAFSPHREAFTGIPIPKEKKKVKKKMRIGKFIIKKIFFPGE